MINDKLLDFVYKSPTAFNATKNIEEDLLNRGYTELFENEKWKLEKGGKYFVNKLNASIVAIEVGTGDVVENGFNMIFSHIDVPSFKIKPNPVFKDNKNYLKLNTEVYGGPLYGTWFDRPLALAGKVYYQNDLKEVVEKVVNINRPILTIPSLAIHLNREANKGFEINAQKQTMLLAGLVTDELERDNALLNLIAKEIDKDAERILDFELFVYDYEKGCKVGINEEFISAGRLDDLWLTFCSLEGFFNSKQSEKTKVAFCLDNEEIGSNTPQGADGNFVVNILERIVIGLGYKEKEDFMIACVNSKGISADVAHAAHPNNPDKEDPTNKLIMGQGVAIKQNANLKYSTTGKVASELINICKLNNIPYQTYVNRSDLVGGGTMGMMVASRLTINIADMGLPLLAMHSARELGACKDTVSCIDLFTKFYEI